MNKALPLIAVILFAAACRPALAAERLRFWNLTTVTITELHLAPAGTNKWGPNQCENDPDKSVDSDERLTITGVEPGRYDVKLQDKNGRICIVRDVEIQTSRSNPGGPMRSRLRTRI